jgi:cytochrome P450
MMTLSIDVAGVDVAQERFDELYVLMDRLARGSTVAHATGDHAAIIEHGDEALAAFDTQFLQPSLARRADLLHRWTLGEISEGDLPRDVLTTLLRNQDRLELAPETVLREVAYFPWVGSHSTSAQLVHAMHHIFDRVAADPDERDRLTHDDRQRQRFVHESMRLHPASPVAERVAMSEVTLRSGRTLPAGERVVLAIAEANQDPAVFGDGASLFDPARSLPGGVPPWGLSFGHGTHACLGQELAGGTEPDEALDHHLLGSVALMAGAMLAAGVRPDPDDPPALDTTTTRAVWGRYPVLFTASR